MMAECELRRDTVRFTVYGQIYSMKNSKQGHHPHPKAVKFGRDFALQARHHLPDDAPWTEDVGVVVDAWYPSRRQDLDCAHVYDLLEQVGFILNDRQVKIKTEIWHLDRDNPRVRVILWKRDVRDESN